MRVGVGTSIGVPQLPRVSLTTKDNSAAGPLSYTPPAAQSPIREHEIASKVA